LPFSLGGGAAGRSCSGGAALGATSPTPSLARCGHRLVRGGLRRRLGRRLLLLRARSRSLGLGALGCDDGELRPDVDGLALGDDDLLEHARAWARHLGVDLVRRDLEQRLVGLDRLALLLEPLRDRALGDGDAHLRHHDVDGLRGGHKSS
jgi:hypothetical protein